MHVGSRIVEREPFCTARMSTKFCSATSMSVIIIHAVPAWIGLYSTTTVLSAPDQYAIGVSANISLTVEGTVNATGGARCDGSPALFVVYTKSAYLVARFKPHKLSRSTVDAPPITMDSSILHNAEWFDAFTSAGVIILRCPHFTTEAQSNPSCSTSNERRNPSSVIGPSISGGRRHVFELGAITSTDDES